MIFIHRNGIDRQQMPQCVIQYECLGDIKTVNLFWNECDRVRSCSCGCFQTQGLGKQVFLKESSLAFITLVIFIVFVVLIQRILVSDI